MMPRSRVARVSAIGGLVNPFYNPFSLFLDNGCLPTQHPSNDLPACTSNSGATCSVELHPRLSISPSLSGILRYVCRHSNRDADLACGNIPQYTGAR